MSWADALFFMDSPAWKRDRQVVLKAFVPRHLGPKPHP